MDEIDEKSGIGSRTLETVLVLQGGGSLGAYECGVYKSLYKHGIKFDIIAGSSIGAVNASIICSTQIANEDGAKILEDFWLDLADDNNNVRPYLQLASPNYDKLLAVYSSMYAVLYGNPKAFLPRWFIHNFAAYFSPYAWNYLYDNYPLKSTLRKYVNFEKLSIRNNNYYYDRAASDRKNSSKENNNKIPRLIISCTDIQKGEPVIFDSYETDINVDKVVACTSYPFYGIKWSRIDDRYLWDGSLLSNTPMSEAMRASPKNDKVVYIVDVFPRRQEQLPRSMPEVWHRARDIIFMDKTDRNIEKLKIIERHNILLRKIHDIINAADAKIDEKTRLRLKELEQEYNELSLKYSATIKKVIRIGRIEKMHFLLEDADFSPYRIKKLIKEGEEDANRILEETKM